MLALVLLVFVGTLAFVVWTRPSTPTVTPTPGLSPTPIASVASPLPTTGPSPTLVEQPTPTPLEQATPTPVEQATPTPAPTESPAPTAVESPSPTPPPTPVAPARGIKFTRLGLDPPGVEQSRARVITFDVNGPGRIVARVSSVSAGRVRLCTWRGDAGDQAARECENMKNGSVERSVNREGPSTWSISLVGITSNTTASVTLDLSFNTDAPHLTLTGFRFQGTEAGDYNGFTAEVTAAADGDIALDARLDDGAGGEYPYRLTYRMLGGDAVHEETGGPTDRIESSFAVADGAGWRLSLENTQELASSAVFVTATLAFP